MEDVHHTLEHLFAQLGLGTSAEEIDDFIDEHQLPGEVKLVDAPFWSDAQRNFLKEEFNADAELVMEVDELNTRLHHVANQEASHQAR